MILIQFEESLLVAVRQLSRLSSKAFIVMTLEMLLITALALGLTLIGAIRLGKILSRVRNPPNET
jgi:hypothetical protein